MAIYLKKFKNVAEYNAYIASGGTKPKAYLTTDDNVVYYLDEAQGRRSAERRKKNKHILYF